MSIIWDGTSWRPLIPATVNEVWELTTWDEIKREHVPDKGINGRLTYMGTRPGLKSNQSDGRYVGEFPSQSAVNHMNWLKSKMKFFDDGNRVQYGLPDKVVPVIPSKAEHPIAHPPAGFKLVDDHWVVKKSKYE